MSRKVILDKSIYLFIFLSNRTFEFIGGKVKKIILSLIFFMFAIVALRFETAMAFDITVYNQDNESNVVHRDGLPGIDFNRNQLIASIKAGYFNMPSDSTESEIGKCAIEPILRSVLKKHGIYYVKKVFTGFQVQDTMIVNGSDTTYVPNLSNVYLFYQNNGTDVVRAIEELYSLNATLYAEPNYIANRIDRTPCDEYWDYQWNLHTPDPLNGQFGIGAPTAWDGTFGSRQVKIAILDSGIDYLHPDLGGAQIGANPKIVGGYDFADNDNNPIDVQGHGTSCAGIVGAYTNELCSYIAGLAGGWDYDIGGEVGALLYAAKIFRNDNGPVGNDIFAEAIRRSASPNGFGCKILSNSWGVTGGQYYSEVLRSAINYAYSTGASFVASKGNEGSPQPHYPADYDETWITAVGGYGTDGLICRLTNCGYRSNRGLGIDIVAPGILLPALDLLPRYYRSDFGGTSGACPQVSGSIALIRSLVPNLRNEDTDWIIKFSAWDPPSGWDNQANTDGDEWTGDDYYGHGHLRISTAVERIYNPNIYSRFKFYSHSTSGNISQILVRSGVSWTFLGNRYIPEGTYNVDVYDVRVSVVYPESFERLPYVWGIGLNSLGLSGSGPNYQEGYCKVVPGSQTISGCILQTFVYYFPALNRWVPCNPYQVGLNYKLWGIKRLINPTNPGEGKLTSNLLPRSLLIKSAYPNPFNSSTVFELEIPSESDYSLTLYNLLGERVKTLISDKLKPGFYSVRWDGSDNAGKDLSSGVYFCALSGCGKSSVKAITIMH